MKDLFNKNYKTLKMGFAEDIRRWKDLTCLWIGRFNIVKMALLSKAEYRFNAIPIKSRCHHRNRKKNPKLHVEVKAILTKKEVSQYLTSNFTKDL
jgi:hypothetical protein